MNTTENSSSAQLPKKAGMEDYDLVILGGGTGSTIAAWTLAGQGHRVAVVDRKYIGGSCPNIACLTSKNEIHSAKVASYVHNSEEFGIRKDGFAVDMKMVRERKRKMVTALNNLYLDMYKKTGAELIFGVGRFIGPRTVEVTLPDGTIRQLRGKKLIISTGTHATLESIPGLAEAQPLTHIEALELDEIPEHLLVIGGGYIGLELSQAMRRFGSKVSLIERNEQLVNREDDDVSNVLREVLRYEGIEIFLKARVKRVEGRSGESVKLVLAQNGAEKTLEGSHILVASGRTPNTAGLGLESARVELTERGYLKVNERLETTAPGVWGIGEVAGSPLFTHVSIDDSRIVRDNLAGGNNVTTGRQIPFCLFTDPELARVGLSEKEANAQGVPYRLFKIPMEGV